MSQNKFQFIISTTVNYFNTSPPQDDYPVREFLENNDITLLAAILHENLIYFTNSIPSMNNENCIIFYKIPKFGISSSSTSSAEQPKQRVEDGESHQLLKQTKVSNQNINSTQDENDNRNELDEIINSPSTIIKPNTTTNLSIGILTLEGGIIKSIYNSVSRIFSPQVLKKSDYTPEISKLINNLQSTLGSSLGIPESGIQSMHDEINFWIKITQSSQTKSDKEQAKTFAAAVQRIHQQIESIENTNNLSLVEEFLDRTHTNLDELWKLKYPQNRMIDIMDVISSNIIDICIDNLSTEDIWNSNTFNINTLITQVTEIIESWIQICDTLTRLFWPNYTQHQWTGGQHIPNFAIMFKLRLLEIKNIKNLYRQVQSLFTNDESYLKMLNKMFVPFKDINIFDTTPIGQKRWSKSIIQLESILEPIDDTISTILKSQLHNHLDNPRQIVHIFSKFDIVTKRPSIVESLTAEREHFLQTLNKLIADLQTAINESIQNYDENEDVSPIVWESRWLKIVESQIRDIENVMEICRDRNGYQNIEKLLKQLKGDVEVTLKDNFQKWYADSIDGVRRGDLKLHDDKPVVEFEKSGRQLMRVTFNPKIITFCHDIREFENFGYSVPIELRESASHALKFMTYARSLQQIASFHNTIGDRMIACQRPIMLKNAVELSNLVQSKSVAWNDEESVRKYVHVLQSAVHKLSKDNTLLAGYHEQAKKTIIKLMNTDLLRQGQIWKDEMRRLREIIATLESQGYTNLQAFKLHWDHQLYKVLEYQYTSGLVDINHKLPDIHIDLVFRQQQLQFRPPMEEIKSKYYAQLRRFIERPLGFRGLSDQSSNLFKKMVSRNRHFFTGLYKRGEDLLQQLNKVKESWKSWVALGCIDMEQLCNVHLSTWHDWDTNYKECKHFSQQIAKIQNSEERIDCFVINLSPLRSDIEFISRKFWETLTMTLRSSIAENVTVLQEYLQTSLQVLENVPIDENGIIDAGAKYEKIMNNLPKMSELLTSVQEKDTCLAGWCKERVGSLNSIQLQWEQLQPLIDNHHSVLQRQIDIMKDHIVSQIQNLNEEMEKFQIRWESTIKDLESNTDSDLGLFKERQNQFGLIQEKYNRLVIDSNKFNSKFPDNFKTSYDKLLSDVEEKQKFWETYENFLKELDEIGSEEWTVYRRRPYILVDFLNNWQNKSKLETNIVNTRILSQVQIYQSLLPILQSLQSESLTEKHWAKIFSIINKPPKSYHEILLKDVLTSSDDLLRATNEIQNLVRQASSEQIVRQALVELEQWGVTANLKLTPHVDSKGKEVMLIKDFQDILNKIGDNLCLLQSAKNSTSFDSFSDQAEIWETRLNSLDRILTSFNQIQRKWIYLEPIFGAGTLRSEESLFQRIDKDFRYIMKEILNDSRVLSICKIHNILSLIDSLETQLSRCQNTLTSYITAKRNAFPRFYFLGNDDLLEILGQASKENIIQKHIKKLFPGIHHVGIANQDNLSFIKSIHSAEGDEIVLKNVIPINGVPVEEWLNNLVNEIKFTLKDLIFKGCENEKNFNLDFVELYPIQVISLVKYIAFTKFTEKAITSMGLQSLLKSIKDEINYFTKEMNLRKNNSDLLLPIKIRSLLIDLVHQSSIIEYFIEKNVTKLSDWHWLEQLKFYLNRKLDKITIKMVFAEFDYSYEYLGNFNKLVNTSLTHKCYLTLTQAMHLGLGGNPFGPAGTGKTECVKALGALLGRLVLVFNCDENIDTTAMGLILSGLARCGAWGCFDEFNRLQETTLSAISMLIQPLQQALKEKQETVIVLDDPLPLNLHCGIFVTLNPAGEEYGGRQNLPANLQTLFRPIVMQQPEPKEIARVLLFVEGFKYANLIGSRIVELFLLSSKMLSPQRHYDWGLREFKTVLTACGESLRETTISTDDLTEEQEIEIAVRSLRLNTMSKLTLADCSRFDMLLVDIFPNVTLKTSISNELRTAISQTLTNMGYQASERQIEKCLELNEQLQKRMGVVVIGPPNSGKTTLINILKQALGSMSKTIRTYTIAPKSMTRIQLLGKLDPDTRQWNDGVLTTIAVAVNSEPSEIISWIICDGDVDPEWIEALNSVLDDNRLLTLPSGWRIQFGNNVNFIFETHNLSYASPATISRMGIINLSSEDLNESFIIESWLAKQSNIETLRIYVEEYLIRSLEWVWNNKERPIPATSKIEIVLNALQQIPDSTKKDEFCIGVLRGLGSLLPMEIKNKFATVLFQWFDVYVPDQMRCEFSYYNSLRDVIEIYENDETHSNQCEGTNPIRLIKTATVKCHLDVLRSLLNIDEKTPFLLYGPAGCGKTLLLENAVTEFSGYQFLTIKCSAQLTSSYVLYILRQNCLIVSGIRGREYKPRLAKLILYFKNIDLCPIDSWGTSEVIELLLQLFHRNGFYAENLEWINVTGLQICGSFSNSNKNLLSSRFLSVVKLLIIDYPNENDMQSIISHQLLPIYNKFIKSQKLINIERIVDAIINTYSEIKNYFKTEISNHYVFTPKMVTNWIYGLMNYPEKYLQQAIYYEAENIFRNRLITNDDTMNYDNIISRNFKNIFENENNVYFFIPIRAKSSKLDYTTKENWVEIVQKNISICGTEDVIISNPVTKEFLKTTAAICRSLSKPETHLILCGQIGSYRRESLHISCSILHIKCILIQQVKNYSLTDFYNDLRNTMQQCAMEDQVVALLVDQSIISCVNDIMKPIEAVLEGSEIPDLFGDDLEAVANPLRSIAQAEGYQESLSSFFLKRVKENLHLVITLESTTSELNDLFSKYPALYRNSDMVWIEHPCNETIQSLPKLILEQLLTPNITIPIIQHLSSVLPYTGDWANSPYRYDQLIRSYYWIYQKFMTDIKDRLEKLEIGVEKLATAHSVVATLKSDAIEQEQALAEKRKLAKQALEMISSTMRNATEQRSDLLELKKKTQAASEVLIERKKMIELELKEVEPTLREASAAVGQIKTEALSEIRSLRAPPEAIRDILEGVLRLMGIRDTSWNSMKTFLAKRGIKEDIKLLDPARISPEYCAQVEHLLQTKSESFDNKNAKRASAAAAPLAAWVIANVKYSKVIQSIKPLEREQNELQTNLESSENQMKSLVSGLDDVDSRVKELSAQLNGYTQEAAVIEIKLEDARNTLNSAATLIEKLNTEFVSWSKQLEELNIELKTLDIKAFFVSLSVTHFSHLTLEHRINLTNNISSQLNIEQFTLNDGKIITDQEMLQWETNGLTPDSQSIQNAALLIKIIDLPYRVAPIPLLIDPSGSCFQWLQSYLQSKTISFEIINQNNERFTYQLELAIRFGKILIVQDSNNINPPLLSVITSAVHSRFNKKLLQVGNKYVDLHDDFKLILVTKINSIKLNEDISAYITAIQFTITISGLTDQLLSKTITLKRPDLEEKRIELLKNEGNLWKKRLELQDKLLYELSTSQGDILKNEKLIKTLNEIKQSSSSIDNSLQESTDIRKKLMEDYNQFKELCGKTSEFYVGISKIYPISISTFTTIFLQVLDKTEDFDGNSIYRKIIRLTYVNLSRSVIKSKHLALALCICKNAFPKEIPDKEWESFVTNFITSDDLNDQSLYPKWIKKKDLIIKVMSLKLLHPNFYNNLNLNDENLWKNYVNENYYHNNKSNNDKDGNYNIDEIPVNVTDFQKILISQILRPDQMVKVMMKSVAKLLGIPTLSIPQQTIQQIVEEGKSDEPILLITLSGTDPTKELKDYTEQKIGISKYNEISIGKGTEEKSLQTIRKAAENGFWICVKNVHLIPNWLKQLETELQSLSITSGFKLFLTCENVNNFPEFFMSKCNKILYEAPDGIKYKVQRLLQQWGPMLNTKRDPKVFKLYVILFLLNSILQERRSFIPQGWCKWYEFGDSDLRAAIGFISLMENSIGNQMEWSVLRGLILNIAYGGRIDNIQDIGILIQHLEDYFDNHVMNNRWSSLGYINLPQTTRIQDYYGMITQIPDQINPESFGLSKLTNLTKDVLFCRNLLKELRISYFHTNDTENYDKRVRQIMSSWKKLIQSTNLMTNEIKAEVSNELTTPWKAFLLSEIRIAKSLFLTIHTSLSTLHTSMKQMATMTVEEKKLMLTLCENQVPLSWKKIWSGPKLATEYLKAVAVRGTSTEKRFNEENNQIFAEEIDFATVYNVDRFLAALKLSNARQLQKSACDLVLKVTFEERVGSSEKSGICAKIKPMMIDGVQFKNGKLTLFDDTIPLTDSLSSSTFYITFEYQLKQKQNEDLIYHLPLYSNNSREILITTIPVQLQGDKKAIIYAGGALIVPDQPLIN